ncbi:integral membrane protein [Aspergillus taichungensis]|uniref:Integral membrane protein n=1 Tax=Aspergillus taichungensis TaxID=482145 RepID=A0A2J5HQM2_9EURO|nr:integral membrane protein [Aspergillus taichungensis]
MNDLIPGSSCALNDQGCICTNKQLIEDLSVCVTAACTIRETLVSINITNTDCGVPVRDNTAPSIIIPAVGLNVLLLVALRTYTRFKVTASETGLDDWAVLLLAVSVVGKTGLGRDMWTLDFDRITRVIYYSWVQSIFYIICISLTKLCFLFFYLRIFPSNRLRLLIKILFALTVAYGIAFLFVVIFQCQPVSSGWLNWDLEGHGKCMQSNTIMISASAINIVLDVLIIALPIPKVASLQATTSTKVQVIAMFSMGFVITGVSIYRLVRLKVFALSINPTWDNAASCYWSVVEVDVGVLCLCMPATRSLLGRMFPNVFGSSSEPESTRQSVSRRSRPAVATPGNTSFTQLIEMDHVPGSVKSHDDY